MSVFELSKWYADCISDKGDAVILYHAELRIGMFPIHYESLLLKEHDSPVRAMYSLHGQPAPIAKDGCIEWQSQNWRTRAIWHDLSGAHQEVLYESDSGGLRWHCVAPRSVASVQIGSDQSFEGWGYAEHLKLTIPPWRLPIHRLRWGRFVNATDALVWIDWSGPYAKRIAYLNGSPAPAESITDQEVVLDGATALHLEDFRVIREGPLGETALAVFPKLGDLFPESLLNVRECKWISRALLRRLGRPDSIGTAIHEVVEWL